MLQKPPPAVRYCHLRAAECERLATLASDLPSREYYLRLADCWRRLAEDREYLEKVDASPSTPNK